MLGYRLRLTSQEVGRDLRDRFAPEPVEGPMRTPRAQMIADAVGSLLKLDAATRVRYELHADVDPLFHELKMRTADHFVVVSTETPREDVTQIFRDSETAIQEMVKAAEGEYN